MDCCLQISDSEGGWAVHLQDGLPSAAGAILATAMETFGLQGASGAHLVGTGPVRSGCSRTCTRGRMGKLIQSSFKLNSLGPPVTLLCGERGSGETFAH